MNPASPFAFRWLGTHAARSPDAPCIGTPAGWLSYGAVQLRVARMAADLSSRGLARGEFVLIALPNGPAAVVASLAVQSLGACAVEVDLHWDADSLARVVTQTGARIAVIHGRSAVRWSQAVPALGHCYVVHPAPLSERLRRTLRLGSLSQLSEDGTVPGGAARAPIRAKPPDADGRALVLYTSGSTGAPRGVVLTHRNIAANTRSICAYLGLSASDRVMSILPLHYCYGKSLLQTHLFVGGSVFFDHRFMYPRAVLDAMAREQCTGFAGVPATFELMRRQLRAGAIGAPSLRYVTQAGGPLRPDTARWARAAFAPAKLFVMYGQTEATTRLSYLPPARAAEKPGSIGRGMPGVELRVVADDACPLPHGAIGNLIARGDNVTPGYLNDVAATREIIRDGWLWTGDLGYQDEDGFIFLTGRSRDFMKLRGHRVSATEIEDCLCQHPDVSEVAVIGVPDDVEGEIAAAFVVACAGRAPAADALRKFCRDRLAAYKVPKIIRFEKALPRTGRGKPRKADLRLKMATP